MRTMQHILREAASRIFFRAVAVIMLVVMYFSPCLGTEVESTESELIRRIAEACVSGNHDPADCLLLRQGSETLGVPELAEFASLLESKTLDVGNKHMIASTTALLQYAEQKYGEGSFEAIVSRRGYIVANLAINSVEARANAQKNADFATKLSAQNPNNEQYKILELVTRLEKLNSTNPFDSDNPGEWAELWEICKQARPILKGGRCDSPELIDMRTLIYQLGSRNTTYPDYVNVDLMDSVFQDDSQERVFDDHVEHFPLLAWEGSKKLRGENHVQTLLQELTMLESQMSFQTVDYQTLHSRINEIQEILTRYCPQGDINPIAAELLKWDCDISYGQNLYEPMSTFSVLQKIADFYGEESEMYLSNLSRIMYQQVAVNPDRAVALYHDMRELAGKIYSSTSDEYGFFLMNMFHAMQSLSVQNQQLLTDYISEVCNFYRNYHRPTWLSISIGRNLANYLSEMLNQYDLAAEVYTISLEDLAQIVPTSSVLYAYCYYDKAAAEMNATDPVVHAASEQSLRESIQLMKQCHRSATHISYYLGQLLLSLYRDDEAVEVMRQGIADCIPVREDIWRCHMQLSLGNSGLIIPGLLSQQEIDYLFKEAIPVFKQQENHDGVFLDGYRFIGNYYRMKKMYHEAEKIYQQGIDYAEGNYGNTERAEYIWLITALNDLYIGELQNLDAAEQLMDGKIEALQSNPYFSSHDLLIELMWNRYYLINSKSDFTLSIAALDSIIQEANIIFQRSGNNSQLGLQLIKPIIYEYSSKLAPWAAAKKDADETIPTDEISRQEIELHRKTFRQNQEDWKNLFPDFFNAIEEELKKNNPDYLNDTELAQLYTAMSRYYLAVENDTVKAEFYLSRLIQSKNDINRYWGAENLADLKMSQNKVDEVVKLLELEESIARGNKVMTSPVAKAGFYYRLCSAYYKNGQYDAAIKPAQDYFHYQQLILQQNFDLFTQTEREQFVNENGGAGSGGLLLLLPHFPKRLSGECYDAQLAQKGLLLRASERIKRAIQQSQDPKLKAQLDSLDRMNMALKTMNPDGRITETGWQDNPELTKLRQQIEVLERSINRQAAQSINGMNTPNWKELQQALLPGEAAVEFVLGDSVGALVLQPNGEPRYVSLNKACDLWKELQELSKFSASRKAKALYQEDRFHLYERIWQPLEPELQGVETVFFSPTGFLNDLVFAAFKCSETEYLSDRYKLHQMLSTGDLIELRKNTPASKVKSATLIGGIYYSPEHERLAQAKPIATEDERGAILDDGETFGYLSFTLNEVKSLSQIFSDNNVSAKQGTGFEPTEESITKLSNNSPDVLHLSTHGFFVAPDNIKSNKFLSRFPMAMYTSMQRCGLALVDANRTWDGADDRPESNDGIITANEVAMLDLSSTRLAVLSACQTAVGEYSTEGVYGMHRGFKQAGVTSILGTMWNVNDKSTARFMELFYRRWLSGKPMQQSFDEAVRELRGEYPSPYYWAPFVLLDAEN